MRLLAFLSICLLIVIALVRFVEYSQGNTIPIRKFESAAMVTAQILDTLQFEQPDEALTFSYLYYNNYKDLIYIRDGIYHQVGIYDTLGKLLNVFGGEGQGPGQFNLLNGVAFDAKGDILIGDGGFRRIAKFDYMGNFLNIEYIFDESIFPADAEIILANDSTIIIGTMDPISFYKDDFTHSFLFTFFKYPSWIELGRGGYLQDIYTGNISFLLGKSITPAYGKYYFTQWASPIITCLSNDFKTNQYYENPGNHFTPIKKGFTGEIGFHTFNKIVKYTNGKSLMSNIFTIKDNIITVYYTVYRQEQLGRLLYQHQNGKENEYWYQVYSDDMEEYYGEFTLPGKYLGNDGENIYTKYTIGNIEQIIKCTYAINKNYAL